MSAAPQVVAASINAKIKATQMAQQRQNEVAQAKAEILEGVKEGGFGVFRL